MISASPKGKRRATKFASQEENIPSGTPAASARQINPVQESTGSPNSDEPTFLVVGKLRRPHGVKGEIMMDVQTDFPQRLRRGKKLFIGPERNPQVIRSVRSTNNALLISFDGFEDCDQVGVLRNLEVCVQASGLPTLPEGEFYFHQLIGLRVVDEAGKLMGTLSEILETGANNVYVVREAEGKESLIPAIDEVIRKVDLERGEMVVRPQVW
jgi:16S rRNA processing protein RimM